jgi:hypothetical protein
MSIPAPLDNSWLTSDFRFYSHVLVTLAAIVVTRDCFCRFNEKKEKSTKSVDNKCCLYHTEISCNNGKGLFFQNLRVILFDDRTKGINADQQTN